MLSNRKSRKAARGGKRCQFSFIRTRIRTELLFLGKQFAVTHQSEMDMDYEIELPLAVAKKKFSPAVLTEMLSRRVSIEQNKLDRYAKFDALEDVAWAQRDELAFFQTLLYFVQNPHELKQKEGLEVVPKIREIK